MSATIKCLESCASRLINRIDVILSDRRLIIKSNLSEKITENNVLLNVVDRSKFPGEKIPHTYFFSIVTKVNEFFFPIFIERFTQMRLNISKDKPNFTIHIRDFHLIEV